MRLMGSMTIELTDVNTDEVTTVTEENMTTQAVNHILGLNPMGVFYKEGKSIDGVNWQEGLLPICPNMIGGILLFSKALTEQADNIYPMSDNLPVAYASNNVNATAALTSAQGGANAYGSLVGDGTAFLQLKSLDIGDVAKAHHLVLFAAVRWILRRNCCIPLRIRVGDRAYMHCSTGRMHRDSPCSQVRIRRKTAEETLVSLVRQQAQMLVDAELILKEKGKCVERKQGINIDAVRVEIRKLEEKKILYYEKYREGDISKEVFQQQKKALNLQKDELAHTAKELEAVALTEDAGCRENQAAFQIGKYVNMESYDKRVMASLISSAKVIGEDCMEVTWKYQDVYEKILMNIGT